MLDWRKEYPTVRLWNPSDLSLLLTVAKAALAVSAYVERPLSWFGGNLLRSMGLGNL